MRLTSFLLLAAGLLLNQRRRDRERQQRQKIFCAQPDSLGSTFG